MVKILILEDNAKAIQAITNGIQELRTELGEIETIIISRGEEAIDFASRGEVEKFDVILLDYISADNINFHQAVLDKVDSQKVITISNTIDYNRMAEEKGVSRSVQKDYFNLMNFKNKLKDEIKSILI